MLKKSLLVSMMAACLCVGGLAGCSSNNSEDENIYSFTLSLESGKKELSVGDTDKLIITDNGVEPDVERSFKYTTSSTSIAEISELGVITTSGVGTVTFTVTEEVSNQRAKLAVKVNVNADPASGGYNYAAAAGVEAVQKRTEILGKLEKYSMDTHLTGITLFENGGYVKYHSRIDLPTTNYITGYGFGILSEGKITGPLEGDTTARTMYYHSASAEDPHTINAFNNTGSQVSDLSGYITQSYWGTKMNEEHDGYVWYPVLAKDTVGGKANNRPIPVYDVVNPLGLYKTWKIYVKTGASDGLKYRTVSSLVASNNADDPYKNQPYNNRPVRLEDYEFVYQLLLTGSSSMTRGAEMAGDMTYGIKGAKQFYDRTKNATPAEADAIWNDMKAKEQLGVSTGSDANGEFIQLEIINPIDEFTAMYTLSSSLVSPLPRFFFEDISGSSDYTVGVKNYGNFNNADIRDYTLCLGAFLLEAWDKDQQIVFQRNDDWFEVSDKRYLITGVVNRIFTGASQREDYLYDQFKAKLIDAVGIPTKYLEQEIGQPDVYQTKGDATFKLNVNSCTQDRWDELNEKVWKKSGTYECKPWMSNDDFLNGLFYSINREEFAKKRGVQPSINYFSDAYLSDPEHGISYNSTDAHKEAVASYHTVRDGKDNYGYNVDKAVECFKSAVNTLVSQGKIEKGTKSNPTEISITIMWMYQSDPTEYGEDIKSYFESAFNNDAVSGGTIKLNVINDCVTQWEQVYSQHLQIGRFDLGFGAISGNTYNPLNFLEVLKSDNSSGFTLNWGPDTSKIDERHPLIYGEDEESLRNWSFDALWEVADHGGVVDNGSIVKSVKECYIDIPSLKNLDDVATDNLTYGAKVTIPLEFVNVPNVAFDVTSVQLYVTGSNNIELDGVTFENGKITFTISAALAAQIDANIRTAQKMTDKEKYPDDVFVLGNYEKFWSFEVYYSLSIKGGTPSQSYVTVSKNRDAGSN